MVPHHEIASELSVERFQDLPTDQAWLKSFGNRYISEHRHNGIKDVMPNQRHFRDADEIYRVRQETDEKAHQKYPRCWMRAPRDRSQPQVMRVNEP